MKHVLFDLKDCLITSPLNDEEYVKDTLIEAARIGKLKVLKVDTHKFEPYDRHHYKIVCQDKSFVAKSWDEVQEYWWNRRGFNPPLIEVIDKPKPKSKGFK